MIFQVTWRMVKRPLYPIVIKLGRIGDMVMLTAALRLLRARYGKPCYVVGADAWAPDVYRGLSEVEWCGSLPRKAPTLFGFDWLAIRRALRATAPSRFSDDERARLRIPPTQELAAAIRDLFFPLQSITACALLPFLVVRCSVVGAFRHADPRGKSMPL